MFKWLIKGSAIEGASKLGMSALDALEERYRVDMATKEAMIASLIEKSSRCTAENVKLFNANLALSKGNHAKDRTIYELRETLYENTVDMAELTAELRIMKAARARSNANLIPGGPKALENRRVEVAKGVDRALRTALAPSTKEVRA